MGPVAAEPTLASMDSYQRTMPLGLHRLMQAMNALGTLWILALMVLINSDVIGRNLFNAPILGVPEMTSLSIVGIVFLQLADTLRCGRFTRAEILLDSLKRRRPAAADLLQAVSWTAREQLSRRWVATMAADRAAKARRGSCMRPCWPAAWVRRN